MNEKSLESRCFMIRVYGITNCLPFPMIPCNVHVSLLFRYRIITVQDTWISVYSQSLTEIQTHPMILLIHPPVVIVHVYYLVLSV